MPVSPSAPPSGCGVLDDDADDLGHAERGDGEVVAAQAERRQADDEPRRRGAAAAADQQDEEGKRLAQRTRQRGGDLRRRSARRVSISQSNSRWSTVERLATRRSHAGGCLVPRLGEMSTSSHANTSTMQDRRQRRMQLSRQPHAARTARYSTAPTITRRRSAARRRTSSDATPGW